MRVFADIHERGSGVPTLLSERGLTWEMKSLRIGEYHVGGGGVVERKTVRGLHTAIAQGTFWRQLGRLRRGARIPYLLIEGENLDNGPLTPKAVRGACLAVLDLGVGLIRTTEAYDSARWLHDLAQRRQTRTSRNRPPYAQRPKAPPGPAAAEAALSAVPRVSAVSARALLEHFGSLAAVVAAEPREWRQVRGIGAARARALDATIRAPYTTSRS